MNYIISTLENFSLQDIITLLKLNSNLLYEIDTQKFPNDSIYYRKYLKEIFPKKQNDVLNVVDTFQDELYSNNLSDTFFDYILSFSYFRVNNKLFKLPENRNEISKDIFYSECLEYFTCQEVSSFDDSIQYTTDVIVFRNPKVAVFSILELEKELKMKRVKK